MGKVRITVAFDVTYRLEEDDPRDIFDRVLDAGTFQDAIKEYASDHGYRLNIMNAERVAALPSEIATLVADLGAHLNAWPRRPEAPTRAQQPGLDVIHANRSQERLDYERAMTVWTHRRDVMIARLSELARTHASEDR